MHTEVAAGRFRQDLLFRLNTVEIHLPPLQVDPYDLNAHTVAEPIAATRAAADQAVGRLLQIVVIIRKRAHVYEAFHRQLFGAYFRFHRLKNLRVRNDLLGEARGLLDKVRPHMIEQAFHLALETIWRVVAAANRYVDEQAPWALRRTDPARMRTVLYTLAEVLRHLGILTQPFVPQAASALLDQLAVPAEARRFADLAERLPPGRALPAPHGIFPRYVEAETASA